MTYLTAVILALCAAVLVACICRVNLLNGATDDKTSWVLLYCLYAVCAVSVAMDSLVEITTTDYLCIFAVSLNLMLTRKAWENGKPDIVKKD